MNRPIGYIDVDRLQAETSLEEAAAKCGVTLDVKGTGPEVRIDCPFGCPGDRAGRKELAINVENPQKIFQCHAYQCGSRGNLLTLMHGWTTGSPPTGGKLKGEEFQRVKRILAGQDQTAGKTPASKSPTTPAESPAPPPPVNIALIDSPEERIRELHTIDQKLLRDVAAMNPAAAAYVRRHRCLSPESLMKWKAGYLPSDGGGDKRGWSLRGDILYPVLSEQNRVLAWIGRDVQFEEREREFARLVPAERAGKTPPAKHRFPKGFHRGIELFGQQSNRLAEPGFREFIAMHGVIVVEGFNDVIGLDAIGVPAVGIMSNRVTEAQVEKIARFAKQLAFGRIALMFDCDGPGTDGAKEALWQFAERRLDVRLLWSQAMHGGAMNGKQPEALTRPEVDALLA